MKSSYEEFSNLKRIEKSSIKLIIIIINDVKGKRAISKPINPFINLYFWPNLDGVFIQNLNFFVTVIVIIVSLELIQGD